MAASGQNASHVVAARSAGTIRARHGAPNAVDRPSVLRRARMLDVASDFARNAEDPASAPRHARTLDATSDAARTAAAISPAPSPPFDLKPLHHVALCVSAFKQTCSAWYDALIHRAAAPNIEAAAPKIRGRSAYWREPAFCDALAPVTALELE